MNAREKYKPRAMQRCVKFAGFLKREREQIMIGHDSCAMCGNTSGRNLKASFHCFPSDPQRKTRWLRVIGMEEQQLWIQSRVCCCHFPDGDMKKEPSLT